MLFKAYLRDYQFFPIVHLADDNNHKFYDSDLIKNRAKIYFFVESKNYFSNVRLLDNMVSGKVINNLGEIKEFEFDKTMPFDAVIKKNAQDNITHKNKSIDSEVEYLRNCCRNDISYNIIGSDVALLIYKYKFLKQISNFLNKLIHPYSNLLTVSVKGENLPFIFHLYQLINGKIINIQDNFLETNIIYIGKSDNAKGILKGRIYGHEKMLPILGKHGTTHDEILVFIFEIILDIKNNVQKEIYIPVVEEILIRYFMKNSRTTKNKEYISERTGQSENVKKLIKLGFNDYLIELNFNDEVCRFGTDVIPYNKKHFIKGRLGDLHQQA